MSVVVVHDQLNSNPPAFLLRLSGSFHLDLLTPGSRKNLAWINTNFFDSLSMPVMASLCVVRVSGSETVHQRIGQPLEPLDREALDALDALDAALNEPQLCYD